MAAIPITATFTGTSVLTAQIAQRLAAQPLPLSGAGTLTSSLDQVTGLRPSVNAQITAQLSPPPQLTGTTPRTLKMTVTHHDPIELVAGDNWDIGGTLKRSDGSVYDLTNATVQWMLRDPDGVPVFVEGDYAINPGTPPTAGLLTIVIAAAQTATLRPGRYTDWLRSTDAAGTDTLWTGTISVDANPFGD